MFTSTTSSLDWPSKSLPEREKLLKKIDEWVFKDLQVDIRSIEFSLNRIDFRLSPAGSFL